MRNHFAKVISLTAGGLLALAIPTLAQGAAFTIITCAVGARPDGVAVADLNGDGRPDLISANNLADTLTVLMQTTGPLPVLFIAWASANTVKISWPLSATGFVLQTNASLSGTNWKTAGYLITTNGATKGISITSPANRLFFRLEK